MGGKGEVTTSPPPNHTDVASQCSWVDFMPPPLTTTEETCGDTCALVDTMASTFAEYVPPAIRMERAVVAVRTGKLTQSAAAAKFNVAQQRISDELRKVTGSGKTSESQSPQGVSKICSSSGKTKSTKVSSNERRQRIKELCRANDAPREIFDKYHTLIISKARGWLIWKGIDLPEELQGQTTPYQPSGTCDQSSSQLSSLDNARLFQTDQNSGTYENGFDYATGDLYDLDRSCFERIIANNDDDPDFQRAVRCLWELKTIIRIKYNSPEEVWDFGKWNTFVSETQAIISLVSEKAKETNINRLY